MNDFGIQCQQLCNKTCRHIYFSGLNAVSGRLKSGRTSPNIDQLECSTHQAADELNISLSFVCFVRQIEC